MSVSIAIFNQKGGSGKTAVTIHLAGALASLEQDVLVIDLDGQTDMTRDIGFGREVYVSDEDSIFELFNELKGDPIP